MDSVRSTLNTISRAQQANGAEAAGTITESEFASLYSEFRSLGSKNRANVVAQLKDPSQPHFDFTLAKVLEDHPNTTASWAFQDYATELDQNRGLPAQTVVAELNQMLGDEEVALTGTAVAFDNVDDAAAHAKLLGQSSDADAVVVRDPIRDVYFVQTVSELSNLDGPNSSDDIRGNLEGRELPNGFALVSFSDGDTTYSTFNDASVMQQEYVGGVLSALTDGSPIAAAGGHGTFNLSGGPDAKGNYENSIGGHVNPTWGSDLVEARNDITSVLFIAAGCNTGAYQDNIGTLGPNFLEADSARAFIGSKGFMQNGAHMNGIRRIISDMRANPSKPLSEVVEDENRIQTANRLQNASFILLGDADLTYAQILDLKAR